MPHERPKDTLCAVCSHLYRGINYYVCGQTHKPVRDGDNPNGCSDLDDTKKKALNNTKQSV